MAEPKVTGEVCINAKYDTFVPEAYEDKCNSRVAGQGCYARKVPAHNVAHDENICVDVYDDAANASVRLNELVSKRNIDEKWLNTKMGCIEGASRFFMALFQSDSLTLSDRFCGKKETGKSLSNKL